MYVSSTLAIAGCSISTPRISREVSRPKADWHRYSKGEDSMTDSMLKNILERAIQSEEHSYQIYNHLAGKVEKPETKKLLEGLAQQELGHKKLLEMFDPTRVEPMESVDMQDKTLTEFMEPAPLDTNASIQDVMLFAIKKEKSAYEFYQRMSEFSPSAEAKGLFDKLAGEELKHKTNLENLYEDMFMAEN